MSTSQPLHALLEETGWIHALARRLVADPALADDLAQETWVDALEQRPDECGPVRGWLATVMRNNLAKLRRGERHRAAREQDASREERLPSTLDVVERAATHRDVVLAVLALDEPYRSTLLMRFFEQLSYGEIARRTGVTRASVNSRVTRGLERLRARLESTYGGDRRALLSALVPLAKLPTGVASTILGVNVMYAVIGTTAVTLLAVVSVELVKGERDPQEPGAILAVPAVEPEPARPSGQVQEELALPAARAPLAAEPAGTAPELQQRKKHVEQDRDVWQTELYHTRVLPATVEALAVNTGSGDVEVKESASGQLEILAKVSTRLGKVSNDQLTQVFEDHVDVYEEEGMLKIEDGHDDGGWTVSFVVGVPALLPIHANSGSGDVVVRRARGSVNANTGSGDVLIALGNERVEALSANTGSGDVVIEVFGVEKKLGGNTGSGDVTALVLEPASPGTVGLNSGSGDVLLIVPNNVVGSFDLETNGADIVLPPSLGIQVEKDAGGRLRAKGSLGNGGNYQLRSGSGELRVELGNTLPKR